MIIQKQGITTTITIFNNKNLKNIQNQLYLICEAKNNSLHSRIDTIIVNI